MRIILIILCTFCILSCQSDVELGPFPYKLPISVMVWNQGLFNYGSGISADNSSIRPDIEAIKTYINSNDCDICFFTEYASFLDKEQSLPAEDILYKDNYPYKYNYGAGYESKGIVSKFPFSAKSTVLTNGRMYIRGSFYLNEYLIHYVLIHLAPGLDSISSHNVRIAELQELLNNFSPSDRVIIVGDFNTPQKYMYSELDILHNCGYTIGNGYSFGTYPTWQDDPNDNVAVKNLVIKDFYVDDQVLRSDHKKCIAIIDML